MKLIFKVSFKHEFTMYENKIIKFNHPEHEHEQNCFPFIQLYHSFSTTTTSTKSFSEFSSIF